MKVSENRGHLFSTLSNRMLSIRTPKQGTPNFRKLPYTYALDGSGVIHDVILTCSPYWLDLTSDPVAASLGTL